MLAIELRFLSGRYHATPWEHHVNEGLVEWPPSPWRILRALVATWHAKAFGEIPRERLASLLELLAAELPVYYLPSAAAGHTRHYMPSSKGKPTKVLDTFFHLETGLQVQWKVELDTQARGDLVCLLDRLSYLGRAEAWVEASLAAPRAPNTLPAVRASSLASAGEAADVTGQAGQEIARVLCPIAPADLPAWREAAVDRGLSAALVKKRERQVAKGKDGGSVKLTAKDQARVRDGIPASLLGCLEQETGALRKAGWSQPPGSRWVDYLRPPSEGRAQPHRRPPAWGAYRLPTVARFAVACDAPPRLVEALPVAERVRLALMSRSDAAPVFSGKSASGEPLEGHRHALVIPEANGRNGRITHITLFARMGFDELARRALGGLRKVWGHGGHDLQLVLLGMGEPGDFGGLDLQAGHCPLLVESRVWVSRTPFIPTRHPKTRGGGRPRLDEMGIQVGSAEHDLRRLAEEAGLPPVLRVLPVADTDLGGKATRWLAFRDQRKQGGGRRGLARPCGFRLELETPALGPIVLGYGAHFGLGCFWPGALAGGPGLITRIDPR